MNTVCDDRKAVRKGVNVSFYVTPALAQAIKDAAKKDSRTIASYVRSLCVAATGQK